PRTHTERGIAVVEQTEDGGDSKGGDSEGFRQLRHHYRRGRTKGVLIEIVDCRQYPGDSSHSHSSSGSWFAYRLHDRMSHKHPSAVKPSCFEFGFQQSAREAAMPRSMSCLYVASISLR